MAKRTTRSSKEHAIHEDMTIVIGGRRAGARPAENRSSEPPKAVKTAESIVDDSILTIKVKMANRWNKRKSLYMPARPAVKTNSGSLREKTETLHFGSVTVKGGAPAPATAKRNISLGQSALKRGLTALVKPGVTLSRSKGVPKYHVDPNDPTTLIRELNGRHERGVLTGGTFKAAK
jgi:hypothetical protein